MRYSLIFLFFISVFFASCKKDNLDKDISVEYNKINSSYWGTYDYTDSVFYASGTLCTVIRNYPTDAFSLIDDGESPVNSHDICDFKNLPTTRFDSVEEIYGNPPANYYIIWDVHRATFSTTGTQTGNGYTIALSPVGFMLASSNTDYHVNITNVNASLNRDGSVSVSYLQNNSLLHKIHSTHKH